jgi:hypothetical protein
MPKEVKQEPFYVGIKDPTELRRTLLESTRDIVQHLQKSERFKAVRKEKLEEIAKLKSLIKEITKNINKLKQVLPKTKLRASKAAAPEKAVVEKPREEIKERHKIEERPKPSTELEKLESELNEIEKRLGKLE